MFGRYLNKYNDYILLNSGRDRRKPSGRVLIFAAVVVASFVLNVVFLVKHWAAYPSPLDDFQAL